MKQSFFRQGAHHLCFFTVLLSAAAARAQDNYWLLDNNKYFNTVTRAVVAVPPLIGPVSNPDVRAVYDGSGNEMFSYGTSEISKYGSSFSSPGAVQAFPVTSNCKEYYLLNVGTGHGPHVSYMSLTRIDASGTGYPVTLSSSSPGGGSPFYYGAVAAPLNTADGSRYVYHISGDINNAVCYLKRYTIAADGTINTTPLLISSTLPLGGGRMKTSADGQTLAYISTGNQLVTVGVANPASPVVTVYPGTVLAMGPVLAGNSKRWYVSTGSALGYFTENNTVFTQIDNVNGINSDIAQGRDGNVYIANGSPSAASGDLLYFSPTVTAPSFIAVPGAKIVGVNGNSTAYSFGNNVEGENINSATIPASADFTLNNVTATGTVPADIWVCNGTTALPLDATINGLHNSYAISYQYGTYSGGVFTPSTISHTTLPVTGYGSTYSVPFNTGGNTGYLKIIFYVYGPCGNSIAVTKLYQLKPVGLLVDFKMQGPSGCPAQDRVTNIATLAGSSPYIQPVSTPFCKDGWLSSFTAGIFSTNTTVTGPLVINNYTLQAQEVDATGNLVGGIIGTAVQPAGFNNYNLNTLNPGWFISNYNAIKNNSYFKVTLRINTAQCGNADQYSYFRIIDGGPAMPYWKQAPGGLQASNPQLTVTRIFPNPATDKIHLNWSNSTSAGGPARMVLSDVLGKVALQQEINQQNGNNDVIMDVSSLVPGIYHYVLQTASGNLTGNLIKN